MKNLIIIGAGGFGKEVYNFAINSVGYSTRFIVKGFLDDDLSVLDNFMNYPKILSVIDEYSIQPGDVFVCAIGDLDVKQRVTGNLSSKGGEFVSLVHDTAIVHSNVEIGVGTILEPYSFVGADVKIGSHCLIQNNAVIGHDVKVGNYSRIDCHVTLVGGVVIKNFVTIHTGAVINHKVIVEDKATVGACSFVIRKVSSNTTVFGNPAKKIM